MTAMTMTIYFSAAVFWLLLAAVFILGLIAGFTLHVVRNNAWLLRHGINPKDFYENTNINKSTKQKP